MCMNLALGGEGGPLFKGFVPTLEHRRKISLANKGKKRTLEISMEISRRQKGKSLTEEHKKNLAIAMAKVYATRLENNVSFHSTETKNKISQSLLNRNLRGENSPSFGIKRIKIQCPYCEKYGANNVMKRWHFDNCRYKNIDDTLDVKTKHDDV